MYLFSSAEKIKALEVFNSIVSVSKFLLLILNLCLVSITSVRETASLQIKILFESFRSRTLLLSDRHA